MSGRGPKVFPRATGWRRVLLVALASGCAVTAAAAVLGWLVTGGAAAASAVFGGLCVVVLSGITVALIDWSERHAPGLTVTVFMIGFVAKLVILGILLGAVETPAWIDPPWAGLTAVAVVVVWQVAEITAFMKMRVTVEPSDSGSS